MCYGVATISKIDKIIGLFCRIASLLWGSFAKETCNFINATNSSHPIMCRLHRSFSTIRVVYSGMFVRAVPGGGGGGNVRGG